MTTHSILRDNRTLTNRCQIISRNSPYLYLTNVALYGEVTYNLIVDEHDPSNDGFTSGGFINTGVSVNINSVADIDEIYDALEPSLNEIGENTVATITERSAVFYFRVEADENNASPFVGDVTPLAVMSAAIIQGKVISVVKEDTANVSLYGVDFIEAGVVSDEQITSTVNKYNWNQPIPESGQISDPADIIESEPQPNYHVYKVIMGTDENGLPYDLSNPIDFTAFFSALPNTTIQLPVCGNCDAYGNPYALLNGGDASININNVQHYSYYGLTDAQFATLLTGQTITQVINDPTIAAEGVSREYYYDASKCSDACIDLCEVFEGGINWVCCNENAINETTNPDGFYPSCQRCWTNNFQGTSPCTFPTPDPNPVCCDSDYLEYWGNAGIDINVNPLDENGTPIDWLCDPSQCLTLITGETDVDTYEDVDSNYSAAVESLPGTSTNVEFFIFDKKGKIIFDHTDVLLRSPRLTPSYYTSTLVKRIAGIRNMADCAGFVPIAFKTNQDWLNLRLTISETTGDIYQLNFGEVSFLSYILTTVAYGAASNPDGSALLQTEQGSCSIGCNDLTIDLPEACVRKVAMDVKEYTDFTVEIITEQSPEEAYTEFNSEFIVYNIETGERLIEQMGNMSEGSSHFKSFRLLKSTPIGVKAKSRNMLIYKIMDEQGTVIQSKTVYNDSYFEPFKIELVTPGCTDTTAANYDSNAVIDDGSCLDGVLYDCVKSALFDIDILQCDTRENTRSLQIYTIYQSYKEAVKENNEVKIEMYGDKLTELCNCETC